MKRMVFLMMVLLVAVTVKANVVTGPPITGFLIADGSRDVVLTTSSSSFTADMSSYAEWVGNVYALGGYYGTQGIGDVRHEDGTGGFYGTFAGPYAMVGSEANSRMGYFVYKFVVGESGTVTGTGGTITMDVWFNGNPATQGAKMWVGVCNSLVIDGTNYYIGNGASFNRVNMLDKFEESVFGNYTGTITLDIPAGVTKFYIAMEDFGSSGRLAMTSLDVNAVLVAGTPDPNEPLDSYLVAPPWNGVTTGNDSKDIVLSVGDSSWSAGLQSYSAFISDVHSIFGIYGGVQGIADVQYETGEAPLFLGGNIDTDRYVMVGSKAAGNGGWIVYKFVTANGYKTSGGTISADVYFNGIPSTQGQTLWVGVGTPMFVGSHNYSIYNEDDFTKVRMSELFSGDSGNYRDTLSLSVPAGVTEFYVAVANGGSFGRLAFMSLDVDAVLTEDYSTCFSYSDSDFDLDCDVDWADLEEFVQNWMSCRGSESGCGEEWRDVPITIWGRAHDPNMIAYEWSQSQRNETGISGSVVMSTFVGDSNTDILQYEPVISPAVNAGKSIGMEHFMFKMNFGYASANSNFSATTWLDDTEWAQAIRSIECMTQLAYDTGVKALIFDIEPYDIGANYIFTRTEQTELDAAYQRGVEVGNAIKSIDPSITIMLIPEHGAASYWASGNASGWLALNRFRNGLMEAQLTGGVLVGLEGTYGWGSVDVDDVSVRVNGSLVEFTDPAAYRSALISYIQSVAADSRGTTDADKLSYWDNYCGVAPGFWVLSQGTDHIVKREAWYSAALFDTQLTAFKDAGAKWIWGYGNGYPFRQFGTNEVSAAGYQVGGTVETNPDYAISYYYQYSVNLNIDDYIEVFRKHGNFNSADMNNDGYVNLEDFAMLALDWMDYTGH